MEIYFFHELALKEITFRVVENSKNRKLRVRIGAGTMIEGERDGVK